MKKIYENIRLSFLAFKEMSSSLSVEKKSGYILTTQNRIGRGAYGSVYKCTNGEGQTLAIKKIPFESGDGIPCLLEASIMSSLVHPNLARAIKVHSIKEDDKMWLCILQDKAETDMHEYSKAENYKRPNLDELRNWCFGLSQAVACLHKQNIVHGDIKPSNCLLYSDGTIKLTDFTLSTPVRDSLKYHKVCTANYAPLEMLDGSGWNKALDIWSLGCTFYELAFGTYFVPKQSSDKNYSLAVKAWLTNSSKELDINGQEIKHDYKPIEVNKDLDNKDYADFKELLMKMLTSADKRINISQVLDDKWFSGLKKTAFSLISVWTDRSNKNKSNEILNNSLQRHSSNEHILQLAKEIYLCLPDKNKPSIHRACCVVASKLLYPYEVYQLRLSSNVIETERSICEDLHYHLHTLRRID